MTKQQAKEAGFTHEGEVFENFLFFKWLGFNYVPVYLMFNDEYMEVTGQTKTWDIILRIFTEIDLALKTEKSFEAWVGEEL